MERNRGSAVYQVSVAAQQVGLSIRTLRVYEQEGLVRPLRRGMQRLYSDQDLIWIQCISELIHGHGLTTTGIRRLLELIPCWEVKHCPAETAAICSQYLRIPNMATIPPAAQRTEPLSVPAEATPDAQAERAVEVKIFYGVKEFGAILPCMKCIQAERVVRRIADRFPGRVLVSKHDALSEEADRSGVIMTPTVVVNGEVISRGKSLSANRLEQLLEHHLREEMAKTDGDDPEASGEQESPPG
jgi:MerR family transcriptional regulator, heat shock protein HspR